MKKYKNLSAVAFAVYIVLLIWVIVFKLDVRIFAEIDFKARSYNLIPFYNTGGIGDIIDNVLLFIPFGFFLRLKNREFFFANVLIMLGASVAFEIVQFALALGVCDITDVITNLAGGLIGYGLTSLLFTIFKDHHKTYRAMSVTSAILTFIAAVVVIVFSVLMFLNV